MSSLVKYQVKPINFDGVVRYYSTSEFAPSWKKKQKKKNE